MAITTSEAQTKTKLDHLWRLSHAIVTTAPQLSVHYQEIFHKVAATDNQTLAEATQRRCCSHCGVPRVPGHTSHTWVINRQTVKDRGNYKPLPLHYVGRPIDQRAKGQSIRLHSARDIDISCLVCGGTTRYGGSTRSELQKVSANTRKIQIKKRSRKQRHQSNTSNIKALATTNQLSTDINLVATIPQINTPTELNTPVMNPQINSNKQTVNNNNKKNESKKATAINHKASSALLDANTKKQQSSNQLAKTSTQIKDKKANKKQHALSKLLAKGKQQRTDDNIKKNVSLNDFLMDFEQ
ncbi:hypothetical protein BDF19DRAFT_423578 [Syncephalis fuscata]|nr:hypothetical protein BDF19DRAFT_423578 [Syncephalis fuscata]